MKRLSRKCKYALRALYHLTRHYEAGPVSVSDIAEQENIPRKFLEAILVQLRNTGMVESQIGKRGGYRLARSPGDITIGSVLRIIDGPVALLPCASQMAYKHCEECPRERKCETHVIMRKVRDAMTSVLDRTTLAEACRLTDQEAELSYDI